MSFQLDSSSFCDFIRSTKFDATRYGLHILNDIYVIENIVQDAFLKLWNSRDSITSFSHAVGFLKQSIKWECHGYFRNSTNRFHRQMIKLDAFNNYDSILNSNCYNPVCHEEESISEQRLKAAIEAIVHLLHGRERSVMELHLIQGHTHSQIAARCGLPIPAITVIIEKGKLQLKKMLVNAPARTSACSQIRKSLPVTIIAFEPIDGLNKEQNTIYQLRKIGKYDFDQIAAYLNLPSSYIRREYVKAWKITDGQQTKDKPKNCPINKRTRLYHAANLLSA